MSRETQYTIATWARATFGVATNTYPLVKRAREEMREFDTAMTRDELMNEAADVVITLFNLAAHLGRDLHAEIDRKMAINRTRKWIAHGDGTGHHVKEPSND